MARPKKVTSKKKKLIAKPAAKKNKKTLSKKVVSKVKKKKVMAIPKGYSNVTPYLMVDAAAKAIDFYKKVFGAKERMRLEHNNQIRHAELKIGDAIIMVADECPERGMGSTGKGGINIHLYVKQVDAVFEKAVASGAKVIRELTDTFYGDRNGLVQDPFGHVWCISTHIEDVTPAKLRKRIQELFANSSSNK